MKVWVVTAYRFGDKERHSYVVGVFNSEAIAKYASIEEVWRGGKYKCDATCFDIADKPDQEKLDCYKDTVSY